MTLTLPFVGEMGARCQKCFQAYPRLQETGQRGVLFRFSPPNDDFVADQVNRNAAANKLRLNASVEVTEASTLGNRQQKWLFKSCPPTRSYKRLLAKVCEKSVSLLWQ